MKNILYNNMDNENLSEENVVLSEENNLEFDDNDEFDLEYNDNLQEYENNESDNEEYNLEYNI